MRLPPQLLHHEAAPLGSSSPLWGVQGAPHARRQPGLLLSQPEQPLPHTRPRHKDALLFLRRAKTEPGQSHPFGSGAVPGGHRGPLGGTWKIEDVPGLLTSSPMLGHHLLRTSPGGPTVSPCHGSAEPAGRERDPQPPAPQRHRDGKAPGVLGEGEQRGRGAVGPGFVPAAPSTHLAAALRWGRKSRAALHMQDTAPATAPPAQAPNW